MKPGTKIHALLSTARIANVPSVVSNLGVGVLLGGTAAGSSFSWPWLLSVAAVLFYVSGNFLNDWADREWDKDKRPERALPQGMFSANTYLAAAVGGAGIGLALAAFSGLGALLVAAVLVFFIWLYTKVHKTAAWSVIPMGLCRACLPVLGYVAMGRGISATVLFPAAALLLYIIGLSLSARWEARGDLPVEQKWQARGLLVGAGLLAAILPLLIDPLFGWIGLLPFGIWLALCVTKFQSPVSTHVSALLAGIPLVDWIVLLAMALSWLNLKRVESDDVMFITAIILPPLAFVSGRLLQRLAPAT
ncbi:MAG: UbiA family prenyltransferase [Akkermansiaceae bacterium]|nr:UbiA family prenyltransferase [Akkermansiaceae bacterium]